MEWLTTYQIGTNKNTLNSDHYQPCLNIFFVQNRVNTSLYYLGKFYLFSSSKQVLGQTVKTQTEEFHQCLHCLLRYEKYTSF